MFRWIIFLMFFFFQVGAIFGQDAVALTFDDGPLPVGTEPLLKILRDLKVQATFFVVGENALQQPGLVRAIAHDGHELANHSFSHLPMDELSDEQIDLELVATNTLLEAISGQRIRYFRPPGGRQDSRVSRAVGIASLKTVLWTVNGCDAEPGYETKRPYTDVSSMVDYLLARAKNGSVFLLHNGSQITLTALPALVLGLREKGFRLVLVSDLLKEK